jgi:hypothetical protein
MSERDDRLAALREQWTSKNARNSMQEDSWIKGLSTFTDALADSRVKHVVAWIDSNVARFNDNAATHNLRRHVDTAVVELKLHVQFCKVQCDDCRLHCVQSRMHEGRHNCSTDHICPSHCDFDQEHAGNPIGCTLPYAYTFLILWFKSHAT